jgi:hypothetical protein
LNDPIDVDAAAPVVGVGVEETRSPLLRDTKRSGPLPTGRSLKALKPTRSMYAHGTIAPAHDARRAGMSRSGHRVWMISVAGSGASVRSIAWVHHGPRRRAALTVAS